MSVSDIASIIVALATTGSLLYIARQVRITRQQTKGQFLLALDEQFEKSVPITVRVVNEPGFTPTGSEWPQIWRLMSVFERINIMVEDGILDIGLVDRLYGFQVVSLIANDAIYERVKLTGAEWQDFVDLCHALAGYRQQSGAAAHHAAFIERVGNLNKQARFLKNPWRF